MKKLLLILSMAFWGYGMFAQNLNAGDIAFIGFGGDKTQPGFTFITLTDIPANEEIYFTDQGLRTASDWSDLLETHILWTSPATVTSSGTLVHIKAIDEQSGVTTFSSTTGSLQVYGEQQWELDPDGDQILAYQSNTFLPATPSFIAGLNVSVKTGILLDGTTRWMRSFSSSNKRFSYLPWGLENGVNCVTTLPNTSDPNDNRDNARYIGSSFTLEDINDYTNWELSNSPLGITPCDFDMLHTGLKPGAIAFIGYRSMLGSQGFSFIAMEDIAADQQLYITDHGIADVNSWKPNEESHILWTPPSEGIEKGTVVYVEVTGEVNGVTTFDINYGTIQLFGAQTWLLDYKGDQLIAYQSCTGRRDTPTFIAGIQFSAFLFRDLNTGWSRIGDNPDTFNSLLPWGLENGVNCVSLFPVNTSFLNHRDNARYIGTTFSLEDINNYLNWEITNDDIEIDPCSNNIEGAIGCGELNAGDIAFIGYHSTVGQQGFTFVAINDIPADEEIYITNHGLLNAMEWNTRSASHLLWVAPSTGLTQGDIIHVSADGVQNDTTVFSLTSGTIEILSGSPEFKFNTNGDQLLAYQANVPNAVNAKFIAGLQVSNNVFIDATTMWTEPNRDFETTSIVPWGLTNEVKCVAIPQDASVTTNALNNARYIGGTFELYSINNPVNWEKSDHPLGIDVCDFEQMGTHLNPGDIAFIGYQSIPGSVGFTFITLVDLPGNEEIYFTDQGLFNDDTWNAKEESHVRWTAPSEGLLAGTVVHIAIEGEESGATVFSATKGDTQIFGAQTFFLNQFGDQMLAYQTCNGIKETPTFLAGIHMNANGYLDTSTGWSRADNNERQLSYLPWGLENGTNCISIYPVAIDIADEKSNARYIGTSMELADINNYLNWQTDNDILDISPCGYEIDGALRCAGELEPGDIAFIGYNTQSAFTFVTINPIPGNEQFYITNQGRLNDNEWDTSDASHLLWTAPAEGLAVGEIVHVEEDSFIDGASTFTLTHGTIEVFGEKNFRLHPNGDQLIVYQACDTLPANPHFIAAIQNTSSLVNDLTTGWSRVNSNSPSTSVIPIGLTNGVNCLSVTPETQNHLDKRSNARFIGTEYTLDQINDYRNWETSNSPLGISQCDFSTIHSKLKKGDIAFIGYNSTDDDQSFTFVTLEDIAGGTEIYITDRGLKQVHVWNSTEESHVQWKAPAEGLSAGTIVHFIATNESLSQATLLVNHGTATALGHIGWQLDSEGDQLLAYVTCHDILEFPNFIAGINVSISSNIDLSTGWSKSGFPSTNSVSTLPWDLENGVNTVSMFPNTTNQANFRRNAKYIGTTLELADINNYLNWELTDNDVEINACDFNITGADGCVPLPIQLLSFEVEMANDKVRLFWSTASELNNDYFVIERSMADLDWASIGTVKGAGTTDEVNTYEFYDEGAATGLIRYRIKQVDFDGAYTYSPLRSINITVRNEETLFSLYPNPTQDDLTIVNDGSDIQIFNLYGVNITSRLYIKKFSNQETVVDVSTLTSGYYIVKSGNKTLKVLKMK